MELPPHVPTVVAEPRQRGPGARYRGNGADRLHRLHYDLQENPQPQGWLVGSFVGWLVGWVGRPQAYLIVLYE